MLQFTAHTRIFVGAEPLDFRNGIDGTIACCKRRLNMDPMEGAIFLFISQNRKQVRVLFYDGQGFWLCTKRLSSGTFPYWPKEKPASQLYAEQVYLLLRGGDFSQAKGLADWRKIS